jgi:hypothetical protein
VVPNFPGAFQNPPQNPNMAQRTAVRQQTRAETELSRGSTLEKDLRRINKQLQKTYCRIKNGCSQYPYGVTRKMLDDFLASLKTAHRIIKQVNKDSERCKNITRTPDERKEKKKAGCKKIK